MGAAQILSGALQGGVAIAYPLLIWFGLTRFEPRVLALCVLAFAILRFWITGRVGAIRSLGVPALIIGGMVGAVVIWNDAIGLLLMPVAISLAFLFAFGFSLVSGPSMVERFARIQVEDLSEAEIAYCRRVTWVWCGFFILNATIASALAWARALDAWVLYTGFISYLLMGTLFATEYLYRHWRFRRYVGAFTDPVLKRVFPPKGPTRRSHGPLAYGIVAEGLRIESRLVQSAPDTRRLEWRVPEELVVWPGHFPEQALVPGVLQLEWIVREVESWQGRPLRLVGIEKLKFKAPIFPGDSLLVDLRVDLSPSDQRFYRIELQVRDEVATTLQLFLSDERPNTEARRVEAANSETVFTQGEGSWPAPSALLPHAGNMLWLNRILGHREDETVCRVRTEDLGVFLEGTGAAGDWLALEWMAQAVAAHDGVRRQRRSEPIRPGMLLGTKKMVIFGEGIARGREYAVRARHVFGGDTGMVSYDCEVFEIETRTLQAKARLTCRVGTPDVPLV